jgi:hypothetical protein
MTTPCTQYPSRTGSQSISSSMMSYRSVFSLKPTAICLGWSLSCLIKAIFSFSKTPLPSWFDWLDTAGLCTTLFPIDLEIRPIIIWMFFSTSFVGAKVIGAYGYKRTAGTILGALSILSISYSIYLSRRPREGSVKPSDEEKVPLLPDEKMQESPRNVET